MKQYLLFLSFFFIGFYSFSQDYPYTNFSLEEGLPQSQVNVVLQNSRGFLWVGTNGGISRFDGKNFYNYSILDGLSDNVITSIYEDASRNMWVGSLGAICLYKNNTFQSFYLENQFKTSYVQSFLKMSEDEFWIGTDEKGILSFNIKTKVFKKLDAFNEIKKVRHMFTDSYGKIWIAAQNGLYVYDKKLKSISLNGSIDISCTYVCEDLKKNIWVSTYGMGVAKIALKDTVIFDTEIIDDWCRKVICNADGSIWIASKKGISIIRNDKIEALTEENGLLNHNIKEIYEDKDGNIWIGTDGKGLLMYKGKGIVNYYKKRGICSDLMMTFCEDKNQNFWFGTYGNGICKYHNQSYYNYSVQDSIVNNNTIWSSFCDSKGNVWFGSSQGLTVFNERGMRNYSNAEGLDVTGVYDIEEDHLGNMWFAVRDGLVKYENGKFINYFDITQESRKRVNAICRDQDKLWAASDFGLVCYHENKFFVYEIPSDNRIKTSVTSVYPALEYIWLGSSNGLFIFHKQEKRFQKIEIGEEYNSNFINSITKDLHGFMWVGTNNGVFRVDPKVIKDPNTVNLHLLTGDGLPSLECNLNSIYTDKQGFVWVGTASGTSKIDPKIYLNNETNVVPSILITGIKLFLEPINWKNVNADFSSLHTGSGVPTYFALPFQKNYLTFDFIGFYYKNPEKIHYRFQLEGFDKEYSPIIKNAFATYSNLSPGNYTFKVISSCDLKNWSQPASIKFTILSPFWYRWWFISIVLLVLLSLGYFIDRIRSNIRNRKAEAEKFSYQARLLELEQQALNASMNRHFVFNSLNSIQYYINSSDKKSANLYLTKFAKLIRKNLDDLQNEHVTLQEEIERVELYLSLEQMRFEGDFEYVIRCSDEIKKSRICIPSMILQPFVENSILHGILPLKNKGKIEINISKEDNHIVFLITDNGVGIEHSLKHKSSSKDHVSKGMLITKERLNVLKKVHNDPKIDVIGPSEIRDEQGNSLGTKVLIILPVIEYVDSMKDEEQDDE